MALYRIMQLYIWCLLGSLVLQILLVQTLTMVTFLRIRSKGEPFNLLQLGMVASDVFG